MEKSTAHKFDRVAKIYNTPIFQFYYFFVHRSCINFLKNYLKDNSSVLDVACGTGIFLKKLSKEKRGLQLFGIDNSEKMVSIARRRSDITNFKVANAEKIPFEDNSFDLITIIDAFYYFQNQKAAIKECSRTLKPNNYLFIFYPALDILPRCILTQMKFVSRLFFFNLEEYSAFPKLKELEKMANRNNLKLIKKKFTTMHRLLLLQKI
jgi:ubiquinone/menaquinone biosynthesis C-methylase UbiE